MTSSKISPKIRQINFLIIIDLALMLLALLMIQFSNFDVWLQNYFFDFEQETWLIDKDEPIKKFIFYQLPKILMGVAMFVCLAASIISFKNSKFSKYRHKFFLTFLGLILITAVAGNIKKFTNIHCPNRLEIYGGDVPYVRIFDKYPDGFYQKKSAQCFPAGHATVGFALFILFFVFEKKSLRLAAFFGATILGWISGSYQMLKGAHFFGDTLVAMLVCFLLAALLARFYELRLVNKT